VGYINYISLKHLSKPFRTLSGYPFQALRDAQRLFTTIRGIVFCCAKKKGLSLTALSKVYQIIQRSIALSKWNLEGSI
jgi:hypothetical protein